MSKKALNNLFGCFCVWKVIWISSQFGVDWTAEAENWLNKWEQCDMKWSLLMGAHVGDQNAIKKRKDDD